MMDKVETFNEHIEILNTKLEFSEHNYKFRKLLDML